MWSCPPLISIKPITSVHHYSDLAKEWLRMCLYTYMVGTVYIALNTCKPHLTALFTVTHTQTHTQMWYCSLDMATGFWVVEMGSLTLEWSSQKQVCRSTSIRRSFRVKATSTRPPGNSTTWRLMRMCARWSVQVFNPWFGRHRRLQIHGRFWRASFSVEAFIIESRCVDSCINTRCRRLWVWSNTFSKLMNCACRCKLLDTKCCKMNSSSFS